MSIVPVLDRSAPVFCGRLAADAIDTLVAMNGACKVDIRSVRLFMHVDEVGDNSLQSSLISQIELKRSNFFGEILTSDVKASISLQLAAIKRSTPITML